MVGIVVFLGALKRLPGWVLGSFGYVLCLTLLRPICPING